jgi:hypothetical protein
MYQFHFDAQGGNDSAVKTAIAATVKEAAAKIAL